MKVHTLKFKGALLERGFWLYIWKVGDGGRQVFYVGRTGDSSSRYAASPFNRLGQHLDMRPNAKGNALLRNLKGEGLDPKCCDYQLVAVGPIFSEQKTLDKHRSFRDKIAPLENALAQHLKSQGYRVIGKHSSRKVKDEELFSQILSLIKDKI